VLPGAGCLRAWLQTPPCEKSPVEGEAGQLKQRLPWPHHLDVESSTLLEACRSLEDRARKGAVAIPVGGLLTDSQWRCYRESGIMGGSSEIAALDFDCASIPARLAASRTST
jgi:hypothetical protein